MCVCVRVYVFSVCVEGVLVCVCEGVCVVVSVCVCVLRERGVCVCVCASSSPPLHHCFSQLGLMAKNTITHLLSISYSLPPYSFTVNGERNTSHMCVC